MIFNRRWCLNVFLSVCFFSCLRVSAQNNYYTYQKLIDYKSYLTDNENKEVIRLDKKIQKQYLNTISEKNKELIKKFDEKGFLFDTLAYPYLNAVFNYILEKNTLDKTHFHFFVDRTPDVNAYSFEDGTVVCNLGLASIMENESQIAMVFCHELGHYLLNHVNTAIINQLEKYNSPAFLTHVKSIERQQYNSKEQLEDLIINDVYDLRKHNRFQEKAADSLGMLLFLKTGYNCKTVSRVFDILDSAEDKSTFCTISAFFNQEEIAINGDWLKPVKKMSFGAAPKKEITDSLKTHPDCARRKVWMQSFFDKVPKTGADFLIATPEKLTNVKQKAFFEEALYSKGNDNLGLYFYQLIQNNALYPSNKNIKTAIFNAMLSICNHFKTHTLYEVVTAPYITNDSKDEYAKLLTLLDNIDLQQMVKITNNYYRNNKPLITASTEALNNLNTLNN